MKNYGELIEDLDLTDNNKLFTLILENTILKVNPEEDLCIKDAVNKLPLKERKELYEKLLKEI